MPQALVDFIEAGGPNGSRLDLGSDSRFNAALAQLRNQVQQQASDGCMARRARSVPMVVKNQRYSGRTITGEGS